MTAAVVNNVGTPSSSGTFQIDPNAVLDLGASSNQAVRFLTGSMLTLEKGVSETGLLHGFSVQDAIDLVGQSVTSFTAAASGGNTTLTAYNGTSAVDVLTFAGNYTATNFATQGDGNGGTKVVYQAHAAHALV